MHVVLIYKTTQAQFNEMNLASVFIFTTSSEKQIKSRESWFSIPQVVPIRRSLRGRGSILFQGTSLVSAAAACLKGRSEGRLARPRCTFGLLLSPGWRFLSCKLSAPVLTWLFHAQDRAPKGFPHPVTFAMHKSTIHRRRQVASTQLKYQDKDSYTQSSEPILFPKLRIYFADFPYLLCSTN